MIFNGSDFYFKINWGIKDGKFNYNLIMYFFFCVVIMNGICKGNLIFSYCDMFGKVVFVVNLYVVYLGGFSSNEVECFLSYFYCFLMF